MTSLTFEKISDNYLKWSSPLKCTSCGATDHFRFWFLTSGQTDFITLECNTCLHCRSFRYFQRNDKFIVIYDK